MPEQHDLDQKKADVAAIQQGRCPECQASLTALDSPIDHAAEHWDPRTMPPNSDAARRHKLIKNFHDQTVAAKQGS